MSTVLKAEYLGFCNGAKRALDALKDCEKAFILGDVVHNKQVMQWLAKQDKTVIDTVNGNEDRPIVITAHGITLSEYERLKKLKVEIIDTTCIKVKEIYDIGKKLETDGYEVCILGDKHHVEIKGIESRLHTPYIISDIIGLNIINPSVRLGVICQSTFSLNEFHTISKVIKEKFSINKIVNTICDATRKRQAAAKRLAMKSNIMIVIGGEESANTIKLHSISSQYTKSFHIQDVNQLKNEWFIGNKNVGITAGASTPNWIIDEVHRKIEQLVGNEN